MSESLPEDVQAFLRAHVESYEHLAALLLLHRESGRDWSVQELSATLNIPAQLAETAVAGLHVARLLCITCEAPPIRYRYSATSGADATIAKLASEYAENPARVVKLLSANAIERVRTSALRTFADAFVLKEKDPGNG